MISSDLSRVVETPAFPDVDDLDAKVAQYIQQRQVFEALVCWERALFLRQHYLGFERSDAHVANSLTFYALSSQQVWAQARAMCEFCAVEAAGALQTNDLESARRLLRKADALSTENDLLRNSISNHWATYYTRVKKPRSAYECLKKAMAIDRPFVRPSKTKAETRLNACAIQSQLRRHDKALILAQAALLILNDIAEPDEATFLAQAVAHHNIGVEEEFLHKSAQSLLSYRRAVNIASTHCGADHPLTIQLSQTLAAAQSDASSPKKSQTLSENTKYAKAAYSPHRGAKAVPKAIKKAYGIQDDKNDLENIMKPNKAIDMSQFEDKALADDFDFPADTKDVRSLAKDKEESTLRLATDVPMLTPRRQEEDRSMGSDGDINSKPTSPEESKIGENELGHSAPEQAAADEESTKATVENNEANEKAEAKEMADAKEIMETETKEYAEEAGDKQANDRAESNEDDEATENIRAHEAEDEEYTGEAEAKDDDEGDDDTNVHVDAEDDFGDDHANGGSDSEEGEEVTKEAGAHEDAEAKVNADANEEVRSQSNDDAKANAVANIGAEDKEASEGDEEAQSSDEDGAHEEVKALDGGDDDI
ncbi:hypothetical protein LEN26_002065 [Aphanomyces euteiches]|nr:hypothetical protein AeMF1_005130 [Aphanomyces euteiches]KAH9159980.1 hypothetical protein LEN26_002065 [Aphanomyces euteiches]KAH9185202.1 hypothetical protein AeNC1_012821 [Aphanomyces euteiches]